MLGWCKGNEHFLVNVSSIQVFPLHHVCHDLCLALYIVVDSSREKRPTAMELSKPSVIEFNKLTLVAFSRLWHIESFILSNKTKRLSNWSKSKVNKNSIIYMRYSKSGVFEYPISHFNNLSTCRKTLHILLFKFLSMKNKCPNIMHGLSLIN